ncbi:hypothetical protein F4604DRAFT_1764976, partial [Suillus subluteus]
MYRLALKLKNAHLEALAFQAIKSSLCESNILAEAFSWFTAQYTDIQNMELDLLMKFCNTPEVSSHLERVVEAVSQGERLLCTYYASCLFSKIDPAAGGQWYTV